jgi:hypothetical protein
VDRIAMLQRQARAAGRQFLWFNMTAHPVTVWRVGRKVGKFAAKWPPYGEIS